MQFRPILLGISEIFTTVHAMKHSHEIFYHEKVLTIQGGLFCWDLLPNYGEETFQEVLRTNFVGSK